LQDLLDAMFGRDAVLLRWDKTTAETGCSSSDSPLLQFLRFSYFKVNIHHREANPEAHLTKRVAQVALPIMTSRVTPAST